MDSICSRGGVGQEHLCQGAQIPRDTQLPSPPVGGAGQLSSTGCTRDWLLHHTGGLPGPDSLEGYSERRPQARDDEIRVAGMMDETRVGPCMQPRGRAGGDSDQPRLCQAHGMGGAPRARTRPRCPLQLAAGPS